LVNLFVSATNSRLMSAKRFFTTPHSFIAQNKATMLPFFTPSWRDGSFKDRAIKVGGAMKDANDS